MTNDIRPFLGDPASKTDSSANLSDPSPNSQERQGNALLCENSTDSVKYPVTPLKSTGSQDEENCLLDQGKNYENPKQNLVREDGKSADNDIVIDGDSSMNYNLVVNRFRQNSRDLSASSIRNYLSTFENITEVEHLKQYTPKQLAGAKGREIIINYVLDKDKVPVKSQKSKIAGIKAIWLRGMGIPFPCAKWDFGRLPDTGRRNSPRTSDVKPHIVAVEHEEEPYLKSLVLFIIFFGIRPSHACLFRWSHVEYRDGRPYSIITTGLEPGNKCKVPVVLWIPQILADALLTLKKEIPDAMIDDPILPHRKKSGEYDVHTPMINNQFLNQWNRFERKHNLKHWSPVYLRHFHTTMCAGVFKGRKTVGKAMRGQKYDIRDMEEVYDNPDQLCIIEEQEKKLPNGIIGLVDPKNVELEEIPAELSNALLAVTTGKMKKSEFDDLLTAWLLQKADSVANNDTKTGDNVIR